MRFSIGFEDGRGCFRCCHANWNKKPPPNSPQGFNIHEPAAPRLLQLGKETKRLKKKKERERGIGEASPKVLNGKGVLKFDTHLSTENQKPA